MTMKQFDVLEGQKRRFKADGYFVVEVVNGVAIVTPEDLFIDCGLVENKGFQAPKIEVKFTETKKSELDYIERKYFGAKVSKFTLDLLTNDRERLLQIDEVEGKKSDDREQAKALILAYIDQIKEVMK